MDKLFKFLAIILGIIGLISILALFMSVPTWLLWNWVGVSVLGLKEITLVQALGIQLLFSILFKTFSYKSS